MVTRRAAIACSGVRAEAKTLDGHGRVRAPGIWRHTSDGRPAGAAVGKGDVAAAAPTHTGGDRARYRVRRDSRHDLGVRPAAVARRGRVPIGPAEAEPAALLGCAEVPAGDRDRIARRSDTRFQASGGGNDVEEGAV